MNMTHDEMIEVIQAHKEGKAIQVKHSSFTYDWADISNPNFNFLEWVYRVKPEPKPDVVGYYSKEFLMHYFRDFRGECDEEVKITFDGETGKLKSAEVVK